jgi:hypothetical protein
MSGTNIMELYRRISEANFARHFMWVPVTTAWRVLRLRMEETASSYGGQLRMY